MHPCWKLGRLMTALFGNLPLAAGLPVLVPIIPDSASVVQNDTKSAIDDEPAIDVLSKQGAEIVTLDQADSMPDIITLDGSRLDSELESTPTPTSISMLNDLPFLTDVVLEIDESSEPSSLRSTYVKYPSPSIKDELATWPYNPWQHEPATTTVYDLWWEIASTNTMTISPAFETGDYTVLVQTPPPWTDWALSRYWAKIPLHTHDDEIPPQSKVVMRPQEPDIVIVPDHAKREVAAVEVTAAPEEEDDEDVVERRPSSRRKRRASTRTRKPFTLTTVSYSEYHTTRTSGYGDCSPSKTRLAAGQVASPDDAKSAVDGANPPVEVPDLTVVPTKVITDSPGDLEVVTNTLAVPLTDIAAVPDAGDVLDGATATPTLPLTEPLIDSIPAADTIAPEAENTLDDLRTTPTLPLTETVPPVGSIPTDTVVSDAENSVHDVTATTTLPLTETVPLSDIVATTVAPADLPLGKMISMVGDEPPVESLPVIETTPLTATVPLTDTVPVPNAVPLTSPSSPNPTSITNKNAINDGAGAVPPVTTAKTPLTVEVPGVTTVTVSTDAINNVLTTTVAKVDTPAASLPVTGSSNALPPVVPDVTTNSVPVSSVTGITDDLGGVVLQSSTPSTTTSPVANVPPVNAPVADLPTLATTTSTSTPASITSTPLVTSATSSPVVNVPQIGLMTTTTSTSTSTPTASAPRITTTSSPAVDVPQIGLTTTTTTSKAPTTSSSTTSTPTTPVVAVPKVGVRALSNGLETSAGASSTLTRVSTRTL